MNSESSRPGEVDISLWSIIGALFGGIVGSLASQAFSESAPYNFSTTLAIFSAGAFIGVLCGVVFYDNVTSWFSARAAKRVRISGKLAISVIGMLIASGGFLMMMISLRGLTSDTILSTIMGISVILIGFIVMLFPYLSRIEQSIDT